MKEMKNVFYNYYRTVNNGVYQEAEKRRLLELFAAANGMDDDAFTECRETVDEVEREGLNDPIACNSFLLMAQFLDQRPEHLVAAAQILAQFYVQKRYEVPVVEQTRGVWCRSLYGESESVARGLFEYASGKCEAALKTLESVYQRDGSGTWQLPEFIALIARETGDYRKTLRYSVEARSINNESVLEIPWLEALEKEAREMLGTEEAQVVLAWRDRAKKNTFSIGFTG